MVNKEFFLALDMLEKEKKITKDQFIEMLSAGLTAAYKKEFGESKSILVSLNPEKSMIRFFAYKTVVEEVEDPDKEMDLEEAHEIKASYKIGDTVMEELSTKDDFSRIAAQTAKQVVIQRLNDARKSQIMEEMSQREGEIVTCQIRRVENDSVYVEITGTQMEGVMLSNDQIKGEKYKVGDVIKVFVKSVRETTKGTQVLVSRANLGFVRRLFELEVPEIKAGLVEIKKIVREPGYRTKIAIYATDSTIDPVGACVGQKGMRINSIVQELNGEKIDVIKWCEDPLEFIARSLSPAEVIAVKLDTASHSSRAIVPDDMLSLAIGKAGLNVRLAAKLSDWKIDVKKFSDPTIADVM